MEKSFIIKSDDSINYQKQTSSENHRMTDLLHATVLAPPCSCLDPAHSAQALSCSLVLGKHVWCAEGKPCPMQLLHQQAEMWSSTACVRSRVVVRNSPLLPGLQQSTRCHRQGHNASPMTHAGGSSTLPCLGVHFLRAARFIFENMYQGIHFTFKNTASPTSEALLFPSVCHSYLPSTHPGFLEPEDTFPI